MNHEFQTLNPSQQSAVRRVIDRVQSDPSAGQRSEMLPDGSEAYAYQGGQGIHWGLNGGRDGFCIARGIWDGGSA